MWVCTSPFYFLSKEKKFLSYPWLMKKSLFCFVLILTTVSFTKWIILGKPFKSFLPADVTVLLAAGPPVSCHLRVQ